MTDIINKILVYYREIPIILDTYIKTDGHIIFNKDGIYPVNGHEAPRASLLMEDTGDKTKNDKRIAKLHSILGELQKNNQIISFQIKNNLV
jgi:hypothetical protein